MVKFGWPSLLASSAAGAYAVKNVDPELLQKLNIPTAQAPGSVDPQVLLLRSEVERVRQALVDMAQSPVHTTIIHTNTNRNGWAYLFPIVIAGCVFYVYVRFRGWNITDFLFVSQSQLQGFTTSITGGVHMLWEELKKSKDEVVKRLFSLKQGQSKLVDQQQSMDKELKKVENDMDNVKQSTSAISGKVGSMQLKMGSIEEGIQGTRRGIMLLCAAVADMSQRINLSYPRSHSLNNSRGDGNQAPLLASSGLRNLIEGPTPDEAITSPAT